MILCDADIRQISYLRCILCAFEVAKGLNINLAKSEMFRMGDVKNWDNLAWLLGCKIWNLPSVYLGMPLGASFMSK